MENVLIFFLTMNLEFVVNLNNKISSLRDRIHFVNPSTCDQFAADKFCDKMKTFYMKISCQHVSLWLI